MKNLFKGLLIGIISTSLILASVPVFAATIKNISAYINAVTVTIDGKKILNDNLIYNGKIYVNANAIAASQGKVFNWDKKSNKVSISNKVVSTPTPSLGTARNKPANIGSTLKIEYEGLSDKITANVTLSDVIRGQTANEMVKSANMFNGDPKEGYEYLLAKIKFDLVSSKKMYSLTGYNFNLVSGGGKVYENILRISPDPKLDADLYEGSSSEGYVIFEVEKNDAQPTITFGRSYDGMGGIWFKAYK